MVYIIYTKPTCIFCTQAKNLLTERGFEYTEIDITSKKKKKELLSLNPNAKTVPQIFLNNKLIGGYTELAKSLG
mgnify:CR=1 FL=1